MGPETCCAVCQRPLAASEASARREPVCPECRAASDRPGSTEHPARPDGRKPDHVHSTPRASAVTLRLEQPPSEAGPRPLTEAAQAPRSPESDDASAYALAEPPEQNRSGDRPVAEPASVEPAKFGRFAIRGVLGQGAYGKVYRAFDPDLGREVAIKILKRDVSDPDVLRQLRQEARALGQLRHRNIVRVFEDGLDGNEYFIVSRLVDARPLSVVLAEERVSSRQAASWVRDLAEALAYAHKERILHRDVKPANILITSRLEALLADFGLALDVYELNQDGAVLGTPAYMAPEQIAGDPTRIGPHSDQYSLGVVLHEVLTGRRPFHEAVPGQPQSQPPVAGQMGPGVDRRLEAICMKALAPSPVDRYPNLGAMANDLDSWLSGKKIKARPRRLPLALALKRHAAIVTATAIALVLAILLLAQVRSTRLTIARLDRDRLRVIGERDTKIAEVERNTREFASKLAEQAAGFDNERASFRQPLARLHLRRAEAFKAAGDVLEACAHLAAALDLGAQAWNDNEKQIVRDDLAVLAGRLIPVADPSRWPRSGMPIPRLVVPEQTDWLGIETDHPTRRWPARVRDIPQADLRRDVAAAVSPRDEFAVLPSGTIWRAADGSVAESARDEPSGCTAAAFKADGRTVLIAYGNRTVRFWDATTGQPSGDPTRHPQVVTAAAFAPDGRSALVVGHDRIIRRIDPATGRVGGEVLRHPVPVKRLRYEPDGRVFTTLGDDSIERRWDAENGSSRGIPIAHNQSVTQIASSPDRQVVLKVIQGSLPERRSGQLWDNEGRPLGPPFPLFAGSEGTTDAVQDGEAILAATVRGPLLARLAIGPEFAGSVRRADCPVRFSDLGKVALTIGLDESLRLWDVASLQPRGPAFRASRFILALSRNGEIAATRGPGDAVSLWSTTQGKLLAKLDTNGMQVSQLRFSPDGRLALSWSAPASQFGTRSECEVSRWDVATGKSIGATLVHKSRIRSAEFSPDGSTILTLGDAEDAQLWTAETGQLIGSWPGETKSTLLAAAFHPDGKTLLTGGNDGKLWRWSTSTGLAVGAPVMVDAPVRYITFAAKGRVLMTISALSTSLWDVETSRRLAPPLPAGGQPLFHQYAGSGAGLSPDGMRVLTREPYTRSTRLWDATDGRPLGPPCVVDGNPAFPSEDGSLLVTITTHGPRVWDLTTGVERPEFYPFDDACHVVARSHDGKQALCRLPAGPGLHDRETERQGKMIGRYQLLEAASGRPLGEPITLDGDASGVALGPDGSTLVFESLTRPGVSGAGGWSRLHDAALGKPFGQLLPGLTTGFSPDGSTILVGPVAWHVSATHSNDRLPRLGRSMRQVAFEPDGRTVVTLAGPADLRRWDAATARALDRVSERVEGTILSLSPDGTLALLGEGKVGRLVRVETGHEVGPPLNHSKPVTLGSFAPDSTMLVTSEGTTLQVWDARSGRPSGKPRPCTGAGVALTMGPAGTVYVEESTDPAAELGHRHIVWKEAASHGVVIPETEPGGVAAFSPDGRYLYVGGRRSGRLWDLSHDPPRARAESIASVHAAKGVKAVAFASDGRTYAVAFEDGTTEVRDIATDRRIGPPRKPDRNVSTGLSALFRRIFAYPVRSFPNEGTPTTLSFSPDGHTLAIGFDDGLTRLWTVPLAIPERAVSRWLEQRTAVQLMPDLTVQALDRDQLRDRWSASGDVR